MSRKPKTGKLRGDERMRARGELHRHHLIEETLVVDPDGREVFPDRVRD